MKIKSLLTCMMVSLVTILPLQAQVGKEMKAFRNKDGITVTMLNPSLYSLYKQGDLSLPAEEALKDSGLDQKSIVKCKNMFALGMIYWMFDRTVDHTRDFINQKFAKKPEIAEANIKVLNDAVFDEIEELKRQNGRN